MRSFGRNLRREREMRGISLDEIAQHTKISARLLEAIESDRFELLPGGVFNRSFVLHYARYLGLDENQVGAEFDLAAGVSLPVDVEKVAAQREQKAAETPAAEAAAPRTRAVPRVALLAGFCLLLAAAYGSWKWRWPFPAGASGPAASHSSPPAGPAGTPAPAAPPQTRTPVVTQPSTWPAGEAAASPRGAPGKVNAQPSGARLRLQIDTIGDSWAIAHADGQKSWEANLRAGETRTVAANSSIQLQVGNAGAVVLTLNGETQPPLGRKGETKTVRFTPEDLKP